MMKGWGVAGRKKREKGLGSTAGQKGKKEGTFACEKLVPQPWGTEKVRPERNAKLMMWGGGREEEQNDGQDELPFGRMQDFSLLRADLQAGTRGKSRR